MNKKDGFLDDIRAAQAAWISMAIALIIILICMPHVSAEPQAYIARGDPAFIQMDAPGGSCWYFPAHGPGEFYDIPAVPSDDNGTYCHIDKQMSNAMKATQYTLFYEEPAFINGKKFTDISWDNDTLVSSFAKTEPIDESGKEANVIMKDLRGLIEGHGLNTISTVSIEMQEPDLKISQLEQTGDFTYKVSGTSNLADKTPITVKVDEERYYAQHTSNFTFHSVISRQYMDRTGTWSQSMQLPFEDMPAGWHNLTVYAGDLTTTSRFKIDEREWKPAPTPTIIVKYLSNGDIAPEIITVVQTVVKVEVQERWHTPTPTPDITDALGEKVNYPYSPGEVIPGWVGFVCLGLIAVIVIMRDRKWK